MPDGLYYFEATSEACERCQLHEGFHPTDALAHDLCRCTSTAVKLDDTKKKKGKDCVEVFFNMNVDDGTTIERFENHHDDAGCHGGFGDHDIEREYTYTVDPDAELTDDGRFVLDFEGWSTDFPTQASARYSVPRFHECEFLVAAQLQVLTITAVVFERCTLPDGSFDYTFLRVVDETVTFVLGVEVFDRACWDCGSERPRPSLPPWP